MPASKPRQGRKAATVACPELPQFSGIFFQRPVRAIMARPSFQERSVFASEALIPRLPPEHSSLEVGYPNLHPKPNSAYPRERLGAWRETIRRSDGSKGLRHSRPRDRKKLLT